MNFDYITQHQTENRKFWIDEISRLSGDFGVDADRVEQNLSQEVKENGIDALIGHLRLCGAIPERYGHDTSEEKLYSKYTDVVIHEAFGNMGFTSIVLKEHADVADVECVCKEYGFVADAKAFRLSRTAKNQKDFKIQAMDNWKHGKPFAVVVCPIYQLPSQNSQIYQQAAARSVCILSYTHLAVLIRYAKEAEDKRVIILLYEVFKAVEAMNPSKDANAYWQTINRIFLSCDGDLSTLWREEKLASLESITFSREEALTFLAEERQRIMSLSRDEAIHEVLKWRKLDNKVRAVNAVADNGLLGIA